MREFEVAAIFSSSMVLQRNKNIKIFGRGNDGDIVTVRFLDIVVTAETKDGKWTAVLPPHEAGGPYKMSVTCGESEKVFNDIMVGEVWLAGGQSNMELELQNCKNGKEYLSNDRNVNVRFYYTQKNPYIDEKFLESERNTGWSAFNEESAKCWSAVGYFFAKKLAEDLGVTVGLIGCNWGGTSASAWMSRESLICDTELKTYVDEYENAIAGKSMDELDKEYDEYIAYDKAWFEKSQVFYKNNPDGSWEECCEFCGPNKYPGPHCPRNPFHASALYESMLMRVCPYTIKGFLYYQGESDDHKPKMYYKLFTRLIQLWRDDWGDDELPFLMVQLPMHKYKADPDYKHWCLIREAQMKAYKTIKNTGIAVILDCGEFNEIHPKDKVPVGERLELQALKKVYGFDVDADGPMYKSFQYISKGMLIHFLNADNGIDVKGEISGFEVAGEDKTFYPATAEIIGNTIFISSDSVAKVKYGRYCWTNYGDVTVFGKNGIPLAPFRTDVNVD